MPGQTIFQHKVCKMQAKVPADNVQTHYSDGKVVLYTISFSPGEWRILEEE